MHVHGIRKNAASYEHIEPAAVGNERRVLVSELSGKSNIAEKLGEYGLEQDSELLSRVLDRVQDPADPGADFPDAPIEPAIYKQLKGPHRMLIGLANDEICYIIPKRQWDEKPPFCYGLTKAPYGEVNSLGPETGPLICAAFRDLVKK